MGVEIGLFSIFPFFKREDEWEEIFSVSTLTWLILFSYKSWWIVGYPEARGGKKNSQKDKNHEWK